MKRLVILTFFFILIFSYGLFLSQFSLSIMKDEIKVKNAPGFFDYRGVTNAHSSFNKGSLPTGEVIKEAQDAKLDFLFFSDLNHFQPTPNLEGYHEDLLVFLAGSYSYLDSHILLYGKNSAIQPKSLGGAQVLFSEILNKPQDAHKSEFTVLAHPFKGGENWSGPYPPGLNGIEVINLKSVWREAWQKTTLSFFWSVFVFPFNSNLSLIRLYLEPTKEIKLWDELNQKRKSVGFVGNESTARTLPLGVDWLKFPTYRSSFEIASNHILLRSELTGNPQTDRQKVLKALKAGQFYMSLDILANPKGFVSYLEDSKTQKKFQLGSQLSFQEGLVLNVKLLEKPKVPFEIVILKDGKSIVGSHAKNFEFPLTEPGVYRSIVRVIPTFPLPDGKKWITWILTNPFYVSSTKATSTTKPE